MYRAVDLFAGIGGIRMGFDRAFEGGIETALVSDINKYSIQTYQANFQDPDTTVFDTDVTQLDEHDVPAHDILMAGFPCQAFSYAGKRQGFEDTRGTLFFDVARIMRHHKPKVVFCENVKGLIGHNKGKTFTVIANTFKELGYTLFHQVLNSKDYGVPQNRERIYMVAFRNDIAPDSFSFPEPMGTKVTIADIMEEGEVDPNHYLSQRYLEGLRAHRARHESKGAGFGYIIRDHSDIAGAIVCGGSGTERNLLVDTRTNNPQPTSNKGPANSEHIRRMTPREWARLQGFPDDFKFVVSNTRLYQQFGNSVTVPVIEAIARRVRVVLEG